MGAESFLTLQIVDFAEGVDDRVAALLTAGTGITITYNDGAGTLTIANTGLGGSTGSTDNRILRADGTGGATVQNSAVTIDDSGNISGLGTVNCGAITANGAGGQVVNIVRAGLTSFGLGDKNGDSFRIYNNNTNTDLLVINATSRLVECGAITASGTFAQSGTGVVATFGTDPAVVRIGNEGNAATFVNAYVGGYAAAAGASTVYFGQNLYWSGSAWVRPHTSGNTSLFWQQAGAFYFNTGTGFGTTRVTIAHSGNVTLSALLFCGVYTVATLPSAAANAGALAQVTDSSVTTNGSAVSGGGSNRVVVFSNGSTWDVVVA